MDYKDAYIKQLELTIENLQHQVDNLTEIINLLKKEKFGSASEKTPKEDLFGQLGFFDEVESCGAEEAPEPIKTTARGFVRVNPKTKREEFIKDLPIREILCESGHEDLLCNQCHASLRAIGKETVREELEYIPAKLQIVRYTRMAYECPSCKHSDHPYIQKALTPTSLMSHSLASPSSVAHVLDQKYVNAMPLYRQEKDWQQLGICLSRATMANWVIRCSEDYFFPMIDYLKHRLVKRDILHVDETPLQVLKEGGKKAQTKSYMWLYCGGNDGKEPIVLYDYQPSRNGDHATAYLKGFEGYVHADGYSGYNKLKKVTRCGCWAHLRRKFVEAIPAKKAAGSPPTTAQRGRDYCNKLFQIEEKLKGCSAKERYERRLELAKPVLEAFWRWLDSFQFLKETALGKAVTYAKNQKPYLENYLLDGRCELSNNRAENAIRPFAVGRKNWLFSDTTKGAAASAAVYSIIETAKANGLNVRVYLEYLLLYMPDTHWQGDLESLEYLMPWSTQVQAQCKS